MKTNFIARINKLWSLSFSFRNYKKMFPVASILTGIVVWPLLLISLLLSGLYYLYAFILKIASVPVDFLSSVMHEEGKEVKHATQAVVYFFAFPIIFMMYVMIAFFTISLVVLYFMISCLNYAWTMKGFVLRPYVLEGDCEELPEGRVSIFESIKAGVIGYNVSALYLAGIILLSINAIPEINNSEMLITGIVLLSIAFLCSFILYLAILDVKKLSCPEKEPVVINKVNNEESSQDLPLETKEEEPTEEPAPVVEETPIEEPAPVAEEAPVVEEVLPQEDAPAAVAVPVEEPVVEEQPTVEEEAPIEEEQPVKPAKMFEFKTRKNIKMSTLGKRLNLIGIIGFSIAILLSILGIVMTFIDRNYSNAEYMNLCVWDILIYGTASTPHGGLGLIIESSHVIMLAIAILLNLGMGVFGLVFTLVNKPTTNKKTLITKIIVYALLVIAASVGDVIGGLTYIFPITSAIGTIVIYGVAAYKLCESVLGYFNVFKIYDRNDEEVIPTEEETPVEPVEE